MQGSLPKPGHAAVFPMQLLTRAQAGRRVRGVSRQGRVALITQLARVPARRHDRLTHFSHVLVRGGGSCYVVSRGVWKVCAGLVAPRPSLRSTTACRKNIRQRREPCLRGASCCSHQVLADVTLSFCLLHSNRHCRHAHGGGGERWASLCGNNALERHVFSMYLRGTDFCSRPWNPSLFVGTYMQGREPLRPHVARRVGGVAERINPPLWPWGAFNLGMTRGPDFLRPERRRLGLCVN